jgi:hypothetical protein
VKTPERVWSRSHPTRDELLEFLRALERHGISVSTRALFEKRISQPPVLRLALNIKSLMGETVVRDVENILSEGLAPDERRALLEIDAAGLSVPLREIAHGLLAVHERWVVWKSLVRAIKEARANENEHVERKLLDGILGENE